MESRRSAVKLICSELYTLASSCVRIIFCLSVGREMREGPSDGHSRARTQLSTYLINQACFFKTLVFKARSQVIRLLSMKMSSEGLARAYPQLNSRMSSTANHLRLWFLEGGSRGMRLLNEHFKKHWHLFKVPTKVMSVACQHV